MSWTFSKEPTKLFSLLVTGPFKKQKFWMYSGFCLQQVQKSIKRSILKAMHNSEYNSKPAKYHKVLEYCGPDTGKSEDYEDYYDTEVMLNVTSAC